jgi:flagellar biosynthesis protein FlhG
LVSGKGGVGKTNISVNLAIALRKLNKRVTLFDADMALANAHIVMGVQPTMTLVDVLDHEKSLMDVRTIGPLGVRLISGGSGLVELMNVPSEQRSRLIHFVRACNRIMIIVVGEPAAFIDAYACIKILHQNYGIYNFDVIVNRSRDDTHGIDIFKRFKGIVERFLDANLYHVASIPEDNQLHVSVARCNPITIMNPDAPSARAIITLAASLVKTDDSQTNQIAPYSSHKSETSEPDKSGDRLI